jgi:hypothetical protein
VAAPDGTSGSAFRGISGSPGAVEAAGGHPGVRVGGPDERGGRALAFARRTGTEQRAPRGGASASAPGGVRYGDRGHHVDM